MLGVIVSGLTNAAMAEDAIVAVGKPEILERIRVAAAADGIPVGSFVASKVRHLIEHGSEDIWLELIGAMSGSPQPGVAALG